MRRWVAVMAAFSAMWASTQPARAQIEPLVLLDVSRCEGVSDAEVRRITTAELGAAPASARGPGVTEVTVECDAAHVVIGVRDPLTRKGVQRSFDLGLSDPKGRGRLIAIASAELVLASWSELDTKQKLRVEPEGPSPPGESATAARRRVAERMEPYEPRIRTWYDQDTPRDRMFRVVGLASMRAFFGSPGALWGGGLRVGEERFRFFSWSADFLVERGTVGSPGSAFDAFTTTLGGSLFIYGRSGPLTGRLGAGLRAGLAGISPQGQAASGSTLAPWGWPLGTASVSVRISPSLVFDISGEAGYVTLADTGQRGLRGGWFSGQLGFGFVPGHGESPEP